ncbi:Fpg/Nei family DNA glycosylase [Pseudonocardia sp. MH-G8]|uniref:Fpg/Nei family DNA glycosylase n=1 Tax=Pseudonocardia sp. MH-G8 TaxID=1854588 RepID=UPI000BA13B73|nr:DNA-formamidopyrimidine glycosylase family protein [Pseudonocardia sp. MH-G8]OZM79307.1 DNA glycosylase [Pseudonocardia sp. MH-G8]
MPEGHTLHRLADLHRRRYVGRPVAVSSPQGRFTAGAALVDGRVLERSEARGKHLFHHYGPDLVVHVHLGLYGQFGDEPRPVEPPRGQVRMRMVGETHYADLRGATACELITDAEAEAIHDRLGADPLRPDADPDRAWARISRSRAPLATLLMDQSVIAGVGNVYRAEALFRHRLDPQLPGQDLRRIEWDALWADLKDLLGDGYRRGLIRTLRPEHDPVGAPDDAPAGAQRSSSEEEGGGSARRVYVYRRTGEPCLVCATPVAHAAHAARNLFWCPTCQSGRKRGRRARAPVPGSRADREE